VLLFEDYLDKRISAASGGENLRSGSRFTTIEGELSRLPRQAPAYEATGEKIFEQRRLLDTVLSNCTRSRNPLSDLQ